MLHWCEWRVPISSECGGWTVFFVERGGPNVAMQGLQVCPYGRFVSTRSKPPQGELKAFCLHRCFFPVCAVLFCWCRLFLCFKHLVCEMVDFVCFALNFCAIETFWTSKSPLNEKSTPFSFVRRWCSLLSFGEGAFYFIFLLQHFNLTRYLFYI